MASRSAREWREQGPYAKAIERNAERLPHFESSSGAEVDPLYSPEDMADWNYHEKLGYPGEFPFTRGVQPTMYRGRLWTMRQYAGFADAEESNRRYHFLLDQGQTGLSVAFDLPTQIGYDSDDPQAEGEVGKVGVAIASLQDMETLTDGLPLERVTTSMTINATGPILLAMYVAAAKKQGADLAKVGGTTQNDILKEYIARGTYIFPPRPSLRLITDVFAWCKDELPTWNTISISGYHMREAGCTAAQELAFTFADAIEYVDAALDAGLEFDEFAPRLSFFWACHSNFLEEIAKFRASRRMWAEIATKRYGSTNPRSQMLRFHTQTGGATLTAQQPMNNVVRTALQALSAVLGGTQSLHTNSWDEALALPTEESVEMALRTQQLIGFEAGVADVIDPLAGSYYIEALTDRVEEEANAYLRRIEDLGGALQGIEEGFQQARDPGERVPPAAHAGARRADRRRREPLPDRGARGAGAGPARSHGGGAPVGAPRGLARGARRRRRRSRAGGHPRRRARRREHDAAADRGRGGLRDDRRDLRSAPPGVGRVPGSRDDMKVPRPSPWGEAWGEGSDA